MTRLVFKLEFEARDGTVVLFREPRRSDARKALRFINAFVGEEMSGILVTKRKSLREERAWLKALRSSVKKRATVALFVELERRIVGNCMVVRHKGKEAHRATLAIALSREERGKGIAEAVSREAFALATERMKGLERIELAHFDYNKRARALYEKLGFVEVCVIPRAVKEGKAYYDERMMVLEL